jgi:galactokinase
VNLVGEHTDYNDGFVLPLALVQGCVATVRTKGPRWVVRSRQMTDSVVAVPPGVASAASVPLWARYVLGPLWLLADRGVDVPGLEIDVDSDVPLGAGLSSSAALVCSVVSAVDDVLELGLGSDGVLALAREVENVAVGVPTGGMDQLVSLRARAGHALLCDMRDLSTRHVPFDPAAAGLSLLVVDSRAPHQLVDGEYGERRRACWEAARRLGVDALRDVTDVERLHGLDDDVLLRRARHVVTENARVLGAVEALETGDWPAFGALLSASHDSMRDDFEITVPEVDTIVTTLQEHGALGARMTGGGFGGCVVALVPADSEADVMDAVRRAATAAGHADPVRVPAVASDGARRLPD